MLLIFWISIGLFILTSVGFVTMLGLWTYADAKVRTDNPALWTLIVLLIPNLLGLIIYLLVGRKAEQKDVQPLNLEAPDSAQTGVKMKKSEGKFKKPLIVFVICFILASAFMIGSFVKIMTSDSLELPQMGKTVSIGKVENYWNRQWTLSFKASSAEFSKTVSLDSGELAAFRVMGNCDSGKLYLRISQGETVKNLDVSDFFNQEIDLSEFQTGKVKLTIYNEEAKNASITISWRK